MISDLLHFDARVKHEKQEHRSKDQRVFTVQGIKYKIFRVSSEFLLRVKTQNDNVALLSCLLRDEVRCEPIGTFLCLTGLPVGVNSLQIVACWVH